MAEEGPSNDYYQHAQIIQGALIFFVCLRGSGGAHRPVEFEGEGAEGGAQEQARAVPKTE